MLAVIRIFGVHLRLRVVRVLAIASAILSAQLFFVSAAFSTEPKARFCPQCTDMASARALAESMAPPPPSGLGCDDQIPMGEQSDSADRREAPDSCPQVVRRIFIINHLSGTVYAFDVWTEISLPVSESVAMSPVEQLVTDRIVELRLAWDDFTQGTWVQPSEGLTARGTTGPSLNGVDCPEGTALDAVLYPAIMEDYKAMINAAAVQELDPFLEGQSWVSRLTGVGAQALGFGLETQWESNGQANTLYDFEFSVSEDPNPIMPDRLVFDVEYLGETQSGAPMLDIRFNNAASRAAGRSVTALEQGGTVSSECAVAKIEEALTELGYTFHIPPADPTPTAFPEYVGPGGGFNFCSKTLAAKVNGVTQYVFTIYVPCQQP